MNELNEHVCGLKSQIKCEPRCLAHSAVALQVSLCHDQTGKVPELMRANKDLNLYIFLINHNLILGLALERCYNKTLTFFLIHHNKYLTFALMAPLFYNFVVMDCSMSMTDAGA